MTEEGVNVKIKEHKYSISSKEGVRVKLQELKLSISSYTGNCRGSLSI